MRAIYSGLRITTALFVALVMILAAPIHAAHSHGHEAGQLHGPCAICKSQSPASEPLTQSTAGIYLEPVGVLAVAAVPSPISTPEATIASRAPPLSLA